MRYVQCFRRYHLTLFYPPSHLTIPLSVTKSAIMAAQLLSAPVAAGLISLDGALGLRGWQWIAVAEGGVTAAVGVFLKLLLPESPAHVKSLSAEEAAWVTSHVSKCAPVATPHMRAMCISCLGCLRSHSCAACWEAPCNRMQPHIRVRCVDERGLDFVHGGRHNAYRVSSCMHV